MGYILVKANKTPNTISCYYLYIFLTPEDVLASVSSDEVAPMEMVWLY